MRFRAVRDEIHWIDFFEKESTQDGLADRPIVAFDQQLGLRDRRRSVPLESV